MSRPDSDRAGQRAAREWLMAHMPQDFPDLTDGERLTLLSHILRSILAPDDSHRALIDFIADLGVPVHEMLTTAAPLSTDAYTRQRLGELIEVLRWRPTSPPGHVVTRDV